MSDRRAIKIAAGVYVVLWLASVGSLPALPPCDYQAAAIAQEPEPQPAPEITAEIVAPDLAEPGTFVSITIKTNGTKVNLRWQFDGRDDPAHLRLVNQRAAVVTATAGLHTITAYGSVDETPVLSQRTVTFGEPQPPEPPKTLAELAGDDVAALVNFYHRAVLGLAILDTPDDFWGAHEEGLKLAKLENNGARAEIAARLEKGIGRGNGPLEKSAAKATIESIILDLGEQPEPPKPPDPPPGPVPIPVAGLHVLIVEETDDRGRIPVGQLSVLQSTLIPAEVKAKGGQFRQYDDDPPISDPLWSAARSRPRTELPWIIVSDGKKGFEGPLPASIDATIALIRRFE